MNHDRVSYLHHYCQTRYRRLPDSRCLACPWHPGIPRGIQGETRDPCQRPTACREDVPSLGEKLGLDLQGNHGYDRKRIINPLTKNHANRRMATLKQGKQQMRESLCLICLRWTSLNSWRKKKDCYHSFHILYCLHIREPSVLQTISADLARLLVHWHSLIKSFIRLIFISVPYNLSYTCYSQQSFDFHTFYS